MTISGGWRSSLPDSRRKNHELSPKYRPRLAPGGRKKGKTPEDGDRPPQEAMMQALGYVIEFTIHDTFCFLQIANSNERVYCDRGSVFHDELRWPPPGCLLRFNLVDSGSGCRRAIEVRYECEPHVATVASWGSFL
jgi:hypothetical protein